MERFDIEVVENATKTANILPITPYEKVLASSMEDYLNYRNAEENGLLIHLPCKVGDTVYLLNCFMVANGNEIIKCDVDEFTIDGSACYAVLNGNEKYYGLRRFRAEKIINFGKNVFLTREAAEQALKQMGE